MALLGACDVTNNGGNLSRHLGFYQELEIRLKPREMAFFFVLDMKIISTLEKVGKTCSFIQKWLDHLLLMTSYLVTIKADHY